MSENLTTKNIENNECDLKSEVSDYETLMTRLKQIKSNIILLEKTIFK